LPAEHGGIGNKWTAPFYTPTGCHGNEFCGPHSLRSGLRTWSGLCTHLQTIAVSSLAEKALRSVHRVMADEHTVRAVIDEVAQALAVIAPLSAATRRLLTTQAEHAALLEGAVDRAVRALRRLQPTKEG
jgi:hypothetical protein